MEKEKKVRLVYNKDHKYGILMLHGLTATPNDFKIFIEKYKGQNISVSAPLLRGHGTSVSDLESVQWYDWFSDTKKAFFKLRKKCKKIVAIGQSLGGSLALHLASHYKVDGLVLLAPGIFFKNKAVYALPLISLFKRYANKPSGPDIKNDFSRKNAVSYNQTPLKSIAEAAELFKHVKLDLPEIHTPTIIFHSINDHVIDYKSAQYIYENIASKHKKLYTLHKSYHVLSLDNEKNIILKKSSRFINSIFSS